MIAPFDLHIPADTPAKCIVCGKESTLGDFEKNGAIAVAVEPNGVRPICVCDSRSCLGAVTALGGQARMKTVGGMSHLSITPSGDGSKVNVGLADVGATFPAGAFINMYLNLGTDVIPKLKPAPGSVRIPQNLFTLKDSVLKMEEVGEEPEHKLACPCCGEADLWIFEDSPGDVTIACNNCQRSGSGRTRSEAMASLASKKEVME